MYQFLIWNQIEGMIWECGIMYQYNNSTKSQRENYVENSSTEVQLSENSALTTPVMDHQPLVLLKKRVWMQFFFSGKSTASEVFRLTPPPKGNMQRA